jgi:hypothetical protein
LSALLSQAASPVRARTAAVASAIFFMHFSQREGPETPAAPVGSNLDG